MNIPALVYCFASTWREGISIIMLRIVTVTWAAIVAGLFSIVRTGRFFVDRRRIVLAKQ